jgi:SAM-dependent methyltransferase
MDIHAQNKAAWEEAFENRSDTWLDNRLERLATGNFPFLEPEFIAELEGTDFTGKDIAQFSCNDGRELLSICRSGDARSGVGFDIAENMVAYAGDCAARLGIRCRFVATDILAIGPEFHEAFDVVVITIGALTWFEALRPYFERVAACLRPGGQVFLHEMHPCTNLFGASGEAGYDETDPSRIVNSYFRTEPWVETTGMGYLTQKDYVSRPFTSYAFTMGDLIGALVDTGLCIERLKEYGKDLSGIFRRLEDKGIPLSMVLVARKASDPGIG